MQTTVQFYISVTGAKSAKQIEKEVAEIVAYRDALTNAGVASVAPSVARAASPFTGNKSAECQKLESQWEEMTGKGFRCSPQMAQMFKLPETREGQIRQMIELVQSKRAVRTVSGWLPSSMAKGIPLATDSSGEDDNEDTF